MTNAELLAKIKAEIERNRDKNRKSENSYYDVNDIKNAGICRHRRILCEELLSFISTIESEKPIDGLEEEIDACWQNWLSPSNQKEVEGVLPKTEFAMYARHFAEWGYLRATEKYNEIEYNRQRAEESVPKDLEEAAEKHQACIPVDTTIHYCGADEDVYFANRIVESYIAGAKWQEEQMMKEAVEGVVTYDNFGNNVIRAGVFNKDFEYGDKVRVIICKKEETK